MTDLEEFLRDEERVPAELAPILSAIAASSLKIRRHLPWSTGMTRGINPSGERQAELDVFANETLASALLSTRRVAELASEEMAQPMMGPGTVHVAMDPLDGSSNISTNNPMGSILGFYSSKLPASGRFLTGAAFVTYGPMLTLTFSTGGGPVQTFASTEDEDGIEAPAFRLFERDIRIPDEEEVYGFGGLRREWVEPVEKFVSSLESKGMKLRYGGAFVGDFNQVLRYGGIFGYPALKTKPRGKLRVLYEAAPMAYIAERANGRASDGASDILSLSPSTLAETTPLYVGTRSLVDKLEAQVRVARAQSSSSSSS